MEPAEEQKLLALSVSDLKRALQERGVDYSDCVEKIDLVRKLIQAGGLPAAAPSAANSSFVPFAPRKYSAQIVGLDCEVVDTSSDKPELAIIFCHGYGANKYDLVSLADHICRKELRGQVPKARFIFPDAILSLPQGGRTWWPLDLQRLVLLAMAGQVRNEVPPGIDKAREAIIGLVEHIRQELGLSYSKIIIGGFSQGAMLSVDVALHLPENVGHVFVLSGTLICEPVWKLLLDKHKDLQVLQSHGTNDPLLVYSGALQLRELLEKGGAKVEFLSFPGQHNIGLESLSKMALRIADVARK